MVRPCYAGSTSVGYSYCCTGHWDACGTHGKPHSQERGLSGVRGHGLSASATVSSLSKGSITGLVLLTRAAAVCLQCLST